MRGGYLRSQQELANKLGICRYQRIEHFLNILFPKIIRLAAHHQGWRQAVGVDGRVVTVKSTCCWVTRTSATATQMVQSRHLVRTFKSEMDDISTQIMVSLKLQPQHCAKLLRGETFRKWPWSLGTRDCENRMNRTNQGLGV